MNKWPSRALLMCVLSFLVLVSDGCGEPDSPSALIKWLESWADPGDGPPFSGEDLPVRLVRRMDGARMSLLVRGRYRSGCRRGDWQHNGSCPMDQLPFNVREIPTDVYVDEEEISVGRFSRFVRATAYVTDAERTGESLEIGEAGYWSPVRGASWRTRHSAKSETSSDDYPVVHVSWSDAAAYCNWVGAELPREVLFERILRDQHDGLLFPWGDSWPAVTGDYNLGDKALRDKWKVGKVVPEHVDGVPDSAMVGWGTRDKFGLLNAAGNVSEWCRDGYGTRMSDFVEPLMGGQPDSEHVVRGASWATVSVSECLCSFRRALPSSAHADMLGFRCVREVPGTFKAPAKRN
jgi:sulfatase modifying factor 1